MITKYFTRPALVLVPSILIASVFITTPATADFRICNKTGNRVGIAIGYKTEKEWISEGWWNIKPGKCESIFLGNLSGRYYYVHAIDYDKGGVWAGKAFLCTSKKLFTIKGIENCKGRGYRNTGFFEVDTGNESDWTVNLTDNDNGSGDLPITPNGKDDK